MYQDNEKIKWSDCEGITWQGERAELQHHGELLGEPLASISHLKHLHTQVTLPGMWGVELNGAILLTKYGPGQCAKTRAKRAAALEGYSGSLRNTCCPGLEGH